MGNFKPEKLVFGNTADGVNSLFFSTTFHAIITDPNDSLILVACVTWLKKR